KSVPGYTLVRSTVRMTSSTLPRSTSGPVGESTSIAGNPAPCGVAVVAGGSGDGGHLGRAERTSTGAHRDRAEALGALPRGGLDLGLGLAAAHHGVDGADDEEEQHRADDHEVDDRLDEHAVLERPAPDVELQAREVGLAGNGDEVRDQVGEGVDD